MMRLSKTLAFWPVMLSLLAVDCATKELAVEKLSPAHVPHPVVGDMVRFTLAYNPDAAMGLSLGSYSRIGFSLIALAMLCMLALYRRRTPQLSSVMTMSLALISGGAIGNMSDRIRSSRGVVDFIDVGLGNARFYTFNVADAAVFCGALLLFAILMRDERRTRIDPPSG